MTTHRFSLRVQGIDVTSAEIMDAIWEAGCRDSTIGTCDGIQHAHFDRVAPSVQDAMRSAVHEVESIPGARITHIRTDRDWTPIESVGYQLR